jgi:hypothetical protein
MPTVPTTAPSRPFRQPAAAKRPSRRIPGGPARQVHSATDLRGRKVVVAMAGNLYTETGTKFRLPDMLANRADTYNLGDIIGSNTQWFKASYIENAVSRPAWLVNRPCLEMLANFCQELLTDPNGAQSQPLIRKWPKTTLS